MLATRRPLETIGMNSVTASPTARRSARLSADVSPKKESPQRRPRQNAGTSSNSNNNGGGGTTTTTSTKNAHNGGDGLASGKRQKRRKDYDQESDGFVFTKSKRAKSSKEETAMTSIPRATDDTTGRDDVTRIAAQPRSTAQRPRQQLPSSPERQNLAKPAAQRAGPVEISTRSPFKPAHAESHARTHRSASPAKPLRVVKKRKNQADAHVEEGGSSRIVLPASDTPIIRRNKAMRQSVANGDRRRSSSGLRGMRVSSMMDEGKWNALPHSDVTASEFYTIISSDLTEPRRMRLLLGWCGDRALPSKAQAPITASKESSEVFQASQAARIIQDELSKELSTNGALSEWFSRDIDASPPRVVLRKKANPRNIANAAKAEELERELERLKLERKAWDEVSASADRPVPKTPTPESEQAHVHAELLTSPQRAILERLNQFDEFAAGNLDQLQQRLQGVSSKLELSVDSFAHSVHAIGTTRELAERIAVRSTADAARELKKRDQDESLRSGGRQVDGLDALRGLARALNASR